MSDTANDLLFSACSSGNLAAVTFILEHAKFERCTDTRHWAGTEYTWLVSPVRAAARGGHLAVVRHVFDNNLDFAFDYAAKTLPACAESGSVELVAYVRRLCGDAPPGDVSELVGAAAAGGLPMLHYVLDAWGLDHGAVRAAFEKQSLQGMFASSVDVLRFAVDSCGCTLTEGAMPNLLFSVLIRGQEAVLRYMVGAGPSAAFRKLDLAAVVRSGNVGLLETLLAMFADARVGRAVCLAAELGRATMLQVLLDSAGDKCAGVVGTALVPACRGGHVDCVRLLCETGALREKDINAAVPVVCQAPGNPSVVRLLIAAGASVGALVQLAMHRRAPRVLMACLDAASEVLDAGSTALDVVLASRWHTTALFVVAAHGTPVVLTKAQYTANFWDVLWPLLPAVGPRLLSLFSGRRFRGASNTLDSDVEDDLLASLTKLKAAVPVDRLETLHLLQAANGAPPQRRGGLAACLALQRMSRMGRGSFLPEPFGQAVVMFM